MMNKKKNFSKRAQKTKFEELPEMDMPKTDISAEEDLKLEGKLAKKLKIKNRKLRGDDNSLNMLFEGISFVLDSLEEGEEIPDAEELPDKKICMSNSEETNGLELVLEEVPAKAPSRNKKRKRKLSEQGQEDNVISDTADGVSNPLETDDAEVKLVETPAKSSIVESGVKYVAPHLRFRAGNESEDHTQIRRRVRGLLNRLSESSGYRINVHNFSYYQRGGGVGVLFYRSSWQ